MQNPAMLPPTRFGLGASQNIQRFFRCLSIVRGATWPIFIPFLALQAGSVRGQIPL
jgi:hypothetical protein